MRSRHPGKPGERRSADAVRCSACRREIDPPRVFTWRTLRSTLFHCIPVNSGCAAVFRDFRGSFFVILYTNVSRASWVDVAFRAVRSGVRMSARALLTASRPPTMSASSKGAGRRWRARANRSGYHIVSGNFRKRVRARIAGLVALPNAGRSQHIPACQPASPARYQCADGRGR